MCWFRWCVTLVSDPSTAQYTFSTLSIWYAMFTLSLSTLLCCFIVILHGRCHRFYDTFFNVITFIIILIYHRTYCISSLVRFFHSKIYSPYDLWSSFTICSYKQVQYTLISIFICGSFIHSTSACLRYSLRIDILLYVLVIIYTYCWIILLKSVPFELRITHNHILFTRLYTFPVYGT